MIGNLTSSAAAEERKTDVRSDDALDPAGDREDSAGMKAP
jgi:hypothetical protein